MSPPPRPSAIAGNRWRLKLTTPLIGDSLLLYGQKVKYMRQKLIASPRLRKDSFFCEMKYSNENAED
jgi:hypothetical protein